jgi:hypothetical protein
MNASFPENVRVAYTLSELTSDDCNLLVMYCRIGEMLNWLN